MRMNRAERVALHKKQERIYVGKGVPALSELDEGVPVIRSTPDGIIQYIKFNNQLYKSTFELVTT